MKRRRSSKKPWRKRRTGRLEKMKKPLAKRNRPSLKKRSAESSERLKRSLNRELVPLKQKQTTSPSVSKP